MANIRPSHACLVLAAALFAAAGLAPVPSVAEPKPPTEEQSADVLFAKSLVGKTYDDELDIEGWEDLGGGLVAPPIYVHEYQRDDGTILVLTSKETVPQKGDTPGYYEVVDALIVPKPQSDVTFSIACVQGDDQTLRFLGEAKGKEDKDWWTDVRRAWEISLETGAISSVKPKGVKCTNPSY
jgi:hypothetical protein